MTTGQRPILLVGGGSGGHIFPLVAIGEELLTRHQPFIFVGSRKSREETVIKELGWPFAAVSAGKWRRAGGLSVLGLNLVDVGRSVSGVFQAIRLIKKTGARVVMSKGGHVALPVVLAARLLGRSVVIHESDAVMGLANRLSTRFAVTVLTNFAPSVFPFADRRFKQVGMPIRRALRQASELKAPKKSRPLLLILPGSQGSSAINNYVAATLGRLLTAMDVIHLTGNAEYPAFAKLKTSLTAKDQARYKPYRFIDRELPYYFQSADLIVARASATTTAEAALFSKALYLIPLPTAAADHQVANARILGKIGAAVVKEQYQLDAERWYRDVAALMSSPERRRTLGTRLHQYFNEQHTLSTIMTILDDAQS